MTREKKAEIVRAILAMDWSVVQVLKAARFEVQLAALLRAEVHLQLAQARVGPIELVAQRAQELVALARHLDDPEPAQADAAQAEASALAQAMALVRCFVEEHDAAPSAVHMATAHSARQFLQGLSSSDR